MRTNNDSTSGSHSRGSVAISLTKGRIAFVDPQDADLAELSWYFRYGTNPAVGYAVRRASGGGQRFERMHRVVMERMLGRALNPEEMVDHIDRDRLNNRRGNLRLATRSQNGINTRLPANNQSGVKGVYRKGRRYAACIRKDGRLHYLGTFDDLADAAVARRKAEQRLFPEFADSGLA